jgi:hypothetical protein
MAPLFQKGESMPVMEFSATDGKRLGWLGKATCFMLFLLFLSLLVRADVFEKIDKLGMKCRAGDEDACGQLSELARNDPDGNVRLAAAENLRDKSLAQAIFANIAKYDGDGEVRLAAVNKLTDKALVDNLAQHGKDSAVREAAARKLAGTDIPAEIAENADEEAAPQVNEPAAADREPAAPRGPQHEGSGKRMGIAAFVLRAGVNYAFGLGVKKVKGDLNEGDDDQGERTYLQYLRMELIKVSDAVLNGNEVFQYVPAEKLKCEPSEAEAPLDTIFHKNDLYAALSVNATLGVCIGWKKKVNMTTVWEITNSSGYEVKIKTYSKSKQSHGVFPDTENPELETVFVDLARENAQQFLEKLAVLMEEDENLR